MREGAQGCPAVLGAGGHPGSSGCERRPSAGPGCGSPAGTWGQRERGHPQSTLSPSFGHVWGSPSPTPCPMGGSVWGGTAPRRHCEGCRQVLAAPQPWEPAIKA